MPALTDNVLEVGYRLLDKVRGWLLPVPLNACGLIGIQWQGLVPDFMLRPVIRALCRQRLREIDHGSFEANYAAKMEWIEGVRARSKIADLTEKANEQHYEVRGKTFPQRLQSVSDSERTVRFLRTSCCPAWALALSTRAAFTPPGRKLWRRRRFSCWKATARRLS